MPITDSASVRGRLRWVLPKALTRRRWPTPTSVNSSAVRSPSSRGCNGCWPTCRSRSIAAETAIKVTNDALQIWGAAGYSRDNPLERYLRDARMFTIAGGTAQVLRTFVASSILGRKLPQTRDGYLTVGDELGRPDLRRDKQSSRA